MVDVFVLSLKDGPKITYEQSQKTHTAEKYNSLIVWPFRGILRKILKEQFDLTHQTSNWQMDWTSDHLSDSSKGHKI